MKKTLLFGGALVCSIAVYATQHIVTNSGFTFSPAAITINEGDTVVFTIASQHIVREVSETTWDANDNTALAGGFSTPAGGGEVVPDAGMHYYVCVPHASMGMKGTINVLSAAGLNNLLAAEINFFPNPAREVINVIVPGTEKTDIRLSNLAGQDLLLKEGQAGIIETISVADLPRGLYILTINNGVAEYKKTLSLE